MGLPHSPISQPKDQTASVRGRSDSEPLSTQHPGTMTSLSRLLSCDLDVNLRMGNLQHIMDKTRRRMGVERGVDESKDMHMVTHTHI